MPPDFVVDLRDAEIQINALRLEHAQASAHLAHAETAGRSTMMPLLSAQCTDLEARLVRWEALRVVLASSGEAAPPEA